MPVEKREARKPWPRRESVSELTAKTKEDIPSLTKSLHLHGFPQAQHPLEFLGHDITKIRPAVQAHLMRKLLAEIDLKRKLDLHKEEVSRNPAAMTALRRLTRYAPAEKED
ncbi:hypothetical protein AUJ65_01405 [Candidatus Micrarchaeota archaeon CG1_02_51_15]|nr:MAG: hypothetical protein AUJ65_01405 [Candidatus Micrarchaeota archaeon CG1_02_51_15]